MQTPAQSIRLLIQRLRTVLMLSLSAACVLAGCAHPEPLADHRMLPPGTRVEFWVYHDDGGWRKSNIHVLRLPRPMSGKEARLWAEGVGARDAGIRWTHYYVTAKLPGPPPAHTCRSAVYHRNALPYEIMAVRRSSAR